MSTIVTRTGKGAPLTYAEMDANFTNLNNDKIEAAALIPYETSAHASSTYATQTALNTTNATVATKQDALPSQIGNTGKYLGTDGTNLSWSTVSALPSQIGNTGKFLTTDGTNASWATLNTDANTTTKGLYENNATISANYSITSGNNAMSAGPITIADGITVTIPSGSSWTVV